MGRISGKKPSPAIVISIVALVLAVVGTSVAGVATISVLNKKEKKQTRKIATNVVNGLAPGLSVAAAQTAANADKLSGEDAAAFARSTQIDSGSGDNTATTETTLISFPEIGFEVRTDGDADSTNQLRLVTNGAPGTFSYWSTGNPGAVGTLAPTVNFEIPGSGGLNHDIVFALRTGATANDFQSSPVISVSCRFSVPPTVACIGIRSL